MIEGVPVAVSVGVALEVCVGVPVDVLVAEGVTVSVGVGVELEVGTNVLVKACETEGVAVLEGEMVGELAELAVMVGVRVWLDFDLFTLSRNWPRFVWYKEMMPRFRPLSATNPIPAMTSINARVFFMAAS